MVRRAYANGDIYLGTYEGWYCPNEGFRNASDVVETARGTICPNHPDVPLQWLTEQNWFFRLSAYQERLERHFLEHPEFVQPDYRRNEMLGFIRQGLEDFSISRAGSGWGIPFPIAENGETAQREDGSWDPEAGTIYVWYDALINYITGAGFPDDPAAFARWWPADLHVIGKDILRFHTIFWPAMLWSAGLEAPRRVWAHGWLLAAGGERMSKSRGNFLDPGDFVAAFGTRRRALRRAPRGAVRQGRRGRVGRLRPALQRRPRERLRQPRQPDGLDGQPLPRRRAARIRRRPPRPTARGRWTSRVPMRPRRRSTTASSTRRSATLWAFVGEANRFVDAEKPWELNKAAKAGDEAAAARLRTRPRRPGRGVPADRARRRAVPARDRAARPRPARLRVAVRPPTATAARRSSTSCAGAPTPASPDRLTAAEPLFPRLETETAPD